MAPTVPFPRALYPNSHPKGPSTDNEDIKAVKRAISRAGYWPWQTFDEAYSVKFAMEGVKTFQQAHGLTATGFYGKATHDRLVATHAKDKPGEWAFDGTAIKLMETAKKEMTTKHTNVALENARKLKAFCQQFTGSYLYGGEHDGSFENDHLSDRFDCSSSCSFALHTFDILGSSTAQVSSWFETWGESGRGKYVTIHANWEHVWMEFSLPEGYSRFDTSPWNDGGGGPRVRTKARPDANFVHRHPAGM